MRMNYDPPYNKEIKHFFLYNITDDTFKTTTYEYDLATPDLNTNSSCESSLQY